MKAGCVIVLLFFIGFVIAQDPRLVIPKGHTSSIPTVCFSNDGKYILTGSRDYTAILWDQLAHEIQSFRVTNELQAVDISADGKKILTGTTDGNLALWNISGSIIKIFNGHSNFVNSVAFSPDGTLILSGSDDGSAKLWDLQGNLKKTFKHLKAVNSVMFSTNGQSILTGSSDKTAALWNLQGNKIQSFIGHRSPIKDARISKNGAYILTSSEDRTAILWNQNGKQLHQFKHFDRVLSSDISSDNKTIITASFDGFVKIWNTSGVQLHSFKADEWGLSKIRFSPDGNTFITVSEIGNCKQWNLNAKQVQNYQGHAPVINSVELSSNGQVILTACNDGTVKLWDAFHNTYFSKRAHTKKVNEARFSPDGQFFLTGSDDHTAKLWDIHGNELKTFKLDRAVTSVAFSPDGKSILTGCYEGCTKLWDLSGKELALFAQNEFVNTVAFSPDGKTIATSGFQGMINIFEISGKLLSKFKVGSLVHQLRFSHDGKKLITANFNGLCAVWNIATSDLTQNLGRPGDELYSVAVSEDGTLIATGNSAGLIKIYNQENGTTMEIEAHSNKISSLHFSSDSKILASASGDGTVKLWDAQTRLEIIKMVSLDSLDWVVTNAEGLFDASQGAMAQMHYQLGLEVVALEQLKERYYEPGLLSQALGITKNESRNVEDFNAKAMYPELQANIQNDEIIIKLKERTGGIGKLSFFVNDKELIEDANPNRKLELKIKLDPFSKFYTSGTNMISLRVYNKEGWLKSKSYDLEYIPSVSGRGNEQNANSNQTTVFKGKPSLYVLITGTSDYKGSKLDLKFPDHDAKSFANAIKAVGKVLFGDRVYLKLLTTESNTTPESIASRKNIESTLKEYATKANPGDVLLVYFSGHGTTYGEAEKSQFHYLTKDIESEDLSIPDIRNNYTVSSNDLTSWLNAIPARKQVMIIDACHSGKVVESFESVGARNLSPSQIRALDRMKDRTGMFILTGSAADKVSFEASQYGQGLLTYSLLQGMSGLALTDDKRVDVMTLFQYARDKVPELAKTINRVQVPVVASPRSGESFDIGIVDATVKIKVADAKPVFIRNTFLNEQSFADDAGITNALSDYFRSITARGAEADLIYFDINEYQNAYSIKGIYSLNGNSINLKGKLFKNNVASGEFQLTGDKTKMPELIQKIFDKITPMIN
jgi:WD40 repeat protein